MDAQVLKNLSLDSAPLDVKVSGKGKWIFILTDDNRVLIYTAGGQLKDTLSPDYAVSSITPGPADDILLLNSIEKKSVAVVQLSFIETINTQGSPVKGDINAPIEIVEFSEFQCPYCAKLQPVMQEVLDLYPGVVKLVFKHYPLKQHDMALKAAAVSIMADRKGKFWEVHDRLFEVYNKLTEEKILEIATDAGIEKINVQRSWNNKRIYQQIFTDIKDGKKAGVKGVPKVYINGRPLKSRSLDGFKKLIDQEMKRLGL